MGTEIGAAAKDKDAFIAIVISGKRCGEINGAIPTFLWQKMHYDGVGCGKEPSEIRVSPIFIILHIPHCIISQSLGQASEARTEGCFERKKVHIGQMRGGLVARYLENHLEGMSISSWLFTNAPKVIYPKFAEVSSYAVSLSTKLVSSPLNSIKNRLSAI